jgi:hypothetical protein
MQRMNKYLILIIISICFNSACQKENIDDSNTITANWMSNLLKENPDKTIAFKDISIPGSHDAAMYVLEDCVGGNACNTQTQYLNMKTQLEQGLRMFDIRPILYKGSYYTQHATDCNGFGCKGDKMENILTQTKNFLDNHSELVILELSHFCGLESDDAAFLELVRSKLGDRIYKETTASNIPFFKRLLTDFIPTSQKTGKVILIFEGIADSPANREAGLFTRNILPAAGGWTDDNNFPELKRNQLANFTDYENDSTRLFQFSWQITQDAPMAIACVLTPDGATSIQSAANNANVQLPVIVDSLIATNAIRKGKIPNIIYVDFADAFVTNLCIKLSKLNIE